MKIRIQYRVGDVVYTEVRNIHHVQKGYVIDGPEVVHLCSWTVAGLVRELYGVFHQLHVLEILDDDDKPIHEDIFTDIRRRHASEMELLANMALK